MHYFYKQQQQNKHKLFHERNKSFSHHGQHCHRHLPLLPQGSCWYICIRNSTSTSTIHLHTTAINSWLCSRTGNLTKFACTHTWTHTYTPLLLASRNCFHCLRIYEFFFHFELTTCYH